MFPLKDNSDFPRGFKRARAMVILDEAPRHREWYVLVEGQSKQWQVFGLPSDSPFHRLGYNYLWSQVDFLRGDLPCNIFSWWHGCLPDGTKVIRMELSRVGLKFLRRLWEQHESWKQQLTLEAEIPF